MLEKLSDADLSWGAQVITGHPAPPGYGERYSPNLGVDLPSTPRFQRRICVKSSGEPVTITEVRLPYASDFDTHSIERQDFIDATDFTEFLFAPVDDIDSSTEQEVSEEAFLSSLDAGYLTFDNHKRKIPWSYEDMIRLLSMTDPFTGQRIGLPWGNGSFLCSGDHPASDGYPLMPLPGGDRPDFALPVYAHKSGVWKPPGGFGSALDLNPEDSTYDYFATVQRHCANKVKLDISELPFKIMSTRPDISPYTTLHSRLLLTNILISVPYSEEIARKVLYEVPTGKDIRGMQWISARALLANWKEPSAMWDVHRRGLAECIGSLTKTQVANYDLFLSFSGEERAMANDLARELGRRGISVFMDTDIPHGEGITSTIMGAIERSKGFATLLTKSASERSACNLELQQAYLTGQAKGEGLKRIIIINPEDPETQHIPAPFTDSRYHTGDFLAKEIAQRLSQLDGEIGEIPFHLLPWRGRVPVPFSFSGRYREIWKLHDLVIKHQFPLIAEGVPGNVTVVAGETCIGKTTLVANYCQNYEALYTGGIYWFDLQAAADRDDEGIRQVFTEQLRELLAEKEPLDETLNMKQMLRRMAEYVKHDRSLWIIDNLPDTATSKIITELALPYHDVGNIFITRDPEHTFQLGLPTLRLGPLKLHEAQAFLNHYKRAENEQEAAARDAIIEQLGRHPGFLYTAAWYILKHPDVSYQDHLKNSNLRPDTESSPINIAQLFSDEPSE